MTKAYTRTLYVEPAQYTHPRSLDEPEHKYNPVRCTDCNVRISVKLYDTTVRCADCQTNCETRHNRYGTHYSSATGKLDRTFRDGGAQLGHYAGKQLDRCGDCRLPSSHCKCSDPTPTIRTGRKWY